MPVGGHVREARGKLERLGMAHLESRRIIKFGRLTRDRLDDLRPGMSGIDAPQACRAIENSAAIIRGVVHVLRRDEHARGLLELPFAENGIQNASRLLGEGMRVGAFMLILGALGA